MKYCFALFYFKIRDDSHYDNNPGKTSEIEKKKN